MYLPESFSKNITRIWADQGSKWLKDLPELVNLLCAQWQLGSITPFDNLSFNYVARAYSSYYNKLVVLKIGFPAPEFFNEAQALEYYNGYGSVRLLELDQAKSAMLLELVEPATTVRGWFPAHDDKAVQLACSIIKKLHLRPVTTDTHFQTIDQWFSLFDTLVIPEKLKEPVLKARILADELKQTVQQEYLLHGDLHHDNILVDGNGAGHDRGIAIDPKGVVGEQAYEVGAFMCNPEELSQQNNLRALTAARLDQFSNLLSIDRQRLVKACYVRVILSACWTVQCNGDWRDDAELAQIILDC